MEVCNWVGSASIRPQRHQDVFAIVLELYLLDYMIKMLKKCGVGLVGKQCRDHPEDRPENPEPVDILSYVQPAYGVESSEPPVPILATSVVLLALIQ